MHASVRGEFNFSPLRMASKSFGSGMHQGFAWDSLVPFFDTILLSVFNQFIIQVKHPVFITASYREATFIPVESYSTAMS